MAAPMNFRSGTGPLNLFPPFDQNPFSSERDAAAVVVDVRGRPCGSRQPSGEELGALDVRAAAVQRSQTADDSPIVAAVGAPVPGADAVLVCLVQRRQRVGRVDDRHVARRRQRDEEVVVLRPSDDQAARHAAPREAVAGDREVVDAEGRMPAALQRRNLVRDALRTMEDPVSDVDVGALAHHHYRAAENLRRKNSQERTRARIAGSFAPDPTPHGTVLFRSGQPFFHTAPY